MNIEETRDEILKRSVIIKEKRDKRNLRILQCAEVGLVALLLVVIQFIPVSKAVGVSNGYYGTLALGSEVGAYILVGVISFLIGVIITLIALKIRNK